MSFGVRVNKILNVGSLVGLLALVGVIGCGDGGGYVPVIEGETGAAGSAGGRGGSGTGGTAGDTTTFTALKPCSTESLYTSAPTTITFGGEQVYTPACLKIARNTTVTFSGPFAGHQLEPSTRGTSGSPITSTTTGNTASFTFTQPGFFPYYCAFHGDDSGTEMAGVVWVE